METWVRAAAAGAVLLGLVSGARGQDVDLSPPAPAEAMRGFEYVRGRLLELGGEAAPGPAPEIRCGGVAVTFWHEHIATGRRSLASGTAFGERALERATAAAIADAQSRRPEGQNALQEQLLSEVPRDVQLSVEFAGALVPVEVGTFAEAEELFEPALEGVAVRINNNVDGAFPASMAITGRTPAQALAGVISAMLKDPSAALPGVKEGEPGAIATARGAVYYRFRTAHVATLSPGGAPMFLSRCQREVEGVSIDRVSLEDFVSRLAGRLVGRVGRTPAGALAMEGESVTHGREDRLLAAFALARGAWAAEEPRSRAAVALLRSVAFEAQGGPETLSAAQAAFALLVVDELKRARCGEEWLSGVRERSAAVVRAAFDPEKGWSAEAPESMRSVVTLALVRASGGDAAERMRANGAVRSMYRDSPPQRLITHMPWLAWAELELAGSGEVPASAALHDVRSMIWQHQVEEEPGREIFAGGIVFSRRGDQRPTWLGSRPLAFAATMAGDARLTDDSELLPEIMRLTRGMRFLRQLAVDESCGWWYEEPRRAAWSVRSAPWERRTLPEAEAMTLIAVEEFLGALAKRAEGPK